MFKKVELSCYAAKFYNPNIVKSCGAGILPARLRVFQTINDPKSVITLGEGYTLHNDNWAFF
jgi:hypothetical protein